VSRCARLFQGEWYLSAVRLDRGVSEMSITSFMSGGKPIHHVFSENCDQRRSLRRNCCLCTALLSASALRCDFADGRRVRALSAGSPAHRSHRHRLQPVHALAREARASPDDQECRHHRVLLQVVVERRQRRSRHAVHFEDWVLICSEDEMATDVHSSED
jgi:hypothetical protein